MDEWLGHPAVQSGVAPFLVALVVAAALAKSRFLALAQVAGFVVVAALAIGFSFESLTASKKLVLIGMGTGVAVLALEWMRPRKGIALNAVAAMLAIATVWMAWRLLAQKEMGPAILAGFLAALYVAGLVAATCIVSDDPVRGASAGLMLGLGTGGLAVLGASAVLGLVGIAMGVSAGATLLVQMLRGRTSPVGWTIALPASAIAGMAGVLAVTSASLPWYCLAPLLATPFATRLVPLSVGPVWLRAFLSSLAALVPVAIALGLAWTAPVSS